MPVLLLISVVSYATVNYSEYFPNGSTVLQSQSDGWTTPASSSKDIMTPEGCRTITSSSSQMMFIPTRTMAEWVSFRDHHPANISITTCSVVVTGSCGGSANTCTAGSPSGYTDSGCGGSQTWSCLGSGGGSNASCSIGNGACTTSGPYSYGSWSSCSVSCGGGSQTRSESCSYTSCYSPQSTSQSCNTQACTTCPAGYTYNTTYSECVKPALDGGQQLDCADGSTANTWFKNDGGRCGAPASIAYWNNKIASNGSAVEYAAFKAIVDNCKITYGTLQSCLDATLCSGGIYMFGGTYGGPTLYCKQP